MFLVLAFASRCCNLAQPSSSFVKHRWVGLMLFSPALVSYMGRCLGLSQTSFPIQIHPVLVSSLICKCSGPVYASPQKSSLLYQTCPQKPPLQQVPRPPSLGNLQPSTAWQHRGWFVLAFPTFPHIAF